MGTQAVTGPGWSLPSLLSQALVAFTMEFDNEFEHRMPHWTTDHDPGPGARRGPWLVSLVMWANCMRFVDESGVTVREVERLARTRTNWDGMRRWRYITLDPNPAGGRSKQPRADAVVRPTAAGRRAREVWQPLSDVLEQRWRERFGPADIARLRDQLAGLNARVDPELPDCMPILGYGLFSGQHPQGRDARLGPRSRTVSPAASPPGFAGTPGAAEPVPANSGSSAGPGGSGHSGLPLPALLSRVLLAFAVEYEQESRLPLAIGANVLRVLDADGRRMRDLPRLAGVSKESISMALGVLQKAEVVVVEPDPAGGRGQAVRLTPKGQRAQQRYGQQVEVVEDHWRERFGADRVSGLRDTLAGLAGEPGKPVSPLLDGLKPYPGGWRAAVAAPSVLPYYPMVLHRGGFPDGS